MTFKVTSNEASEKPSVIKVGRFPASRAFKPPSPPRSRLRPVWPAEAATASTPKAVKEVRLVDKCVPAAPAWTVIVSASAKSSPAATSALA